MTAKNKGWEIKGIEPNSKAKQIAISKGVVFEEALENIADNSIDVITMWHVLEHVYHLNDRIETIKRILQKDGTLFVAVPNRNSFDATKYQNLWAAYDLPRHLYHFTPKDIRTLFAWSQ